MHPATSSSTAANEPVTPTAAAAAALLHTWRRAEVARRAEAAPQVGRRRASPAQGLAVAAGRRAPAPVHVARRRQAAWLSGSKSIGGGEGLHGSCTVQLRPGVSVPWKTKGERVQGGSRAGRMESDGGRGRNATQTDDPGASHAPTAAPERSSRWTGAVMASMANSEAGRRRSVAASVQEPLPSTREPSRTVS